MKKVCIFKVSSGHGWYRIYRNFVLGVGNVYEIYEGRRHIFGVWRYVDFDAAVDIAVALARVDNKLFKEGEDVK